MRTEETVAIMIGIKAKGDEEYKLMTKVLKIENPVTIEGYKNKVTIWSIYPKSSLSLFKILPLGTLVKNSIKLV